MFVHSLFIGCIITLLHHEQCILKVYELMYTGIGNCSEKSARPTYILINLGICHVQKEKLETVYSKKTQEP